MSTFTLWVPYLPSAVLSSNGPHGSPFVKNTARQEMRSNVFHSAVSYMPTSDIPRYKKGRLSITYRHTFKRPGDGLYRPTDPFNIFEPCKPVVDAIVDLEVLPDDTYKYVVVGDCGIERVERLEDEGLLITVVEIE